MPHSQVQHYSPLQIENCIQDYTHRNRHGIVAVEDNDVDIPLPVPVVAAVAVVASPCRPTRTVISIERGIQGIQTPDLPVTASDPKNRQIDRLGLSPRIVVSSEVASPGRIVGFVPVVVGRVVVVGDLRTAFYRMRCPLHRIPIVHVLHRRWRIGLLRIQLVAHRIRIRRTLDRRTCPCVDYSRGIRRSVVGTFGWRSTGVSSRGSCWDYTVDDAVVESVWRG